MSTPLPGLPPRVEVYEVGPRDGLQNEATVVPVEVKAEFVRRLVDGIVWELGDSTDFAGTLQPLSHVPSGEPV